MTIASEANHLLLLRELAPRVLGTLMRRYRDFPGCEDAVQEALLAAAQQWPSQGVPESAVSWLLHVATRRLTDEIRSETARRLREKLVVSLIPADEQIALAADEAGATERDDTLDLFFMSCHPALSPTSQIALTLRAVGGLTTAEIARAFHVPEATMAQRISRAKQTIKTSNVGFVEPATDERLARLPVVLRVLYLIYNEGYTPSSGEAVHRVDLSTEAIRVARLLVHASDEAPEPLGLLALMLLTEARREARTGPNGELVPLDVQDRSRWNQALVREGVALLDHAIFPKESRAPKNEDHAMERGALGAYQIQAAIAALHDEASSTETTDWPQILALYGALLRIEDSPMARLSHAIALAMVEGPRAGLDAIDALARDPRFSIADNHRLDAARGHLHERAGDLDDAVRCYRRAAAATSSVAERDYLLVRAAHVLEAHRA